MRKRAAIIFFCMALFLTMGVPGLAHGAEGDPVPVADWPALKAAVEAGGAIVLELPPTIEADSTITVPASAEVVLVAHASGSRIIRQSLKTGEFIVSAGAKLTLRGSMTIAHDTNLNGASFVQVQSGGELLLEAQLTADADNVEYGNQNTDRKGEFIKSLIDCSGTLTMVEGSQVSGWTQNKQADRHNVSYDPAPPSGFPARGPGLSWTAAPLPEIPIRWSSTPWHPPACRFWMGPSSRWTAAASPATARAGKTAAGSGKAARWAAASMWKAAPST